MVKEELPFKDISYLELWQPFCSADQNHKLCNFCRGCHEEQFCEFGPVVQEEIQLKDKCYLELWQSFCSVEHNHLCNFGRGYYEEQFCEIILNLDHWLRRKCNLKMSVI